MKIEFSKTQYKTLVKALFLTGWVVNSHKSGEPDDEFERLEQYILSQGKFFDLKNVDFDEKHGKYYHDLDFEQKTLEHLDDFVDGSFWEELIDRLADRDLFKAHGETEIRKMSRDERFTKFREFADPYEAEFAEHGVDNLVIRPDENE
jgi:hypothetical protein